MKVLLSWVNDFADISKLSLADIVSKLNQIGFEVEEIIDKSAGLNNVISAKIIKIVRHPNADKLVVCTADIGGKLTTIVTGATNMKEGDMVALAEDGANLPCGKEIKNSEIRGQMSYGMFCGGDELCVDDSIYEGAGLNGLLILKKDVKPGLKIAEVLGLNEIVLDLKVLPNRPDCNSIMGIARELAAAFNLTFKMPDLKYKTVKTAKNIDVQVLNKQSCPRYMGVVIEDLKPIKTPELIKKRLALCGHSSYNLMVDITNYVLTEVGQPMHAFDLAQIDGGIIVRDAKEEQSIKDINVIGETIIGNRNPKGEPLKCLDNKLYWLNKDNLVIADNKKPLVIAGVLGGKDSGISENTKNVFLESAIFEYSGIRKTRNTFGINSSSGLRYSKGVYFNSAELGLKRALNIIDGLKAGRISDVIIDKYEKKPKQITIKSDADKIKETLAMDITPLKIVKVLNKLDIKTVLDGKKLTSVIPDYRTDLERECDIIEEAGRSFGYDKIDLTKTTKTNFVTCGTILPEKKNINMLKLSAAGEGFNEVQTFQFISPKWVENFNEDPKNYIILANPLGKEYSIMRKSLLPGLLNIVYYNQNLGNKNICLFEIEKVYLPKELPLIGLPYEPYMLGAVSCLDGFYEFRDKLDNIMASLNIELEYRQSTNDFMHPGVTADIYLYNKKIGVIGEVHPTVLESFEINKKVLAAEIDLTAIISKNTENKTGRMPDKLPEIERDLNFVVDGTLPAANIINTAKKAVKNMIGNIYIFDIYTGNQLAGGKKSVAIKFFIKQPAETLTEQQIWDVMNKIIEAEARDNRAELRK